MQIKKLNQAPVPDVYFGEDETAADFKKQNKAPVPKVYFIEEETGSRRKEHQIRQAPRLAKDEIVSE